MFSFTDGLSEGFFDRVLKFTDEHFDTWRLAPVYRVICAPWYANITKLG